MWSPNEFAKSLIDEIIRAISEGSKQMVIWDVNPSSLAVLSVLTRCGLKDIISAIIDSRQNLQGHSFFGIEVCAPEGLPQIEFDTLVVASDKNKEHILEEFALHDNRIPRIILSGNANYEFDDAVYEEILESCAVKPKSGGYPNFLMHLYQALRYIAKRNLKGDVAEFGMYKGGTTVFMARVLEYYGHPARIYGFDTFAGFPFPKSAMDIFKDRKCEFPDYKTVRNYCSPYNIELVKGDICKTYTKLRGIPLALSFFDTDNYTPAKRALELCIRQTVPKGIIAFDHYYSPNHIRTIGERIAARQILKGNRTLNLHGTGIFVKI